MFLQLMSTSTVRQQGRRKTGVMPIAVTKKLGVSVRMINAYNADQLLLVYGIFSYIFVQPIYMITKRFKSENIFLYERKEANARYYAIFLCTKSLLLAVCEISRVQTTVDLQYVCCACGQQSASSFDMHSLFIVHAWYMSRQVHMMP